VVEAEGYLLSLNDKKYYTFPGNLDMNSSKRR